MCSWGKLWTKDTKRPKNPTATSKELGGKTGCQEQKHHTVYAPPALHSTAPKSG